MTNGSSIAFLFQIKRNKVLFLADSHPSVVAASLRNLGYSKSKPLKVNYMQMPHHGSKYNISEELLDLIECQNFIISGDGINKHALPNKEAMVRVMKHYQGRKITFYITQRNSLIESIFSVDNQEDIKDIRMKYSESDLNGIILEL